MAGEVTLWAGGAAAMAAVVLLRISWALPARSISRNALAWALLAAGLALGAVAHGAWGVAIVSLVATCAAFLLLAHAALVTPAGNLARAPDRRAGLAGRGPLRIGGRILTFILAVPAALAVSALAGMGSGGLGRAAGMALADAYVLAFLVMPLVWTLLVVALLMTGRRRRQLLLLAAPALAGGMALLAGGAA